jgi:hypothetical protein
VLSVGRKTRTIPPAIRRALRSRDDRCRFPGCDHARTLQAHHIEHWAKGGETKLENLGIMLVPSPSGPPGGSHAAQRLDVGLSPSQDQTVRSKTPHYPLVLLKELAARPDGLFIQREKALDFFPTFTEEW